MLRTDYLRKCNIAATYYVETNGSHEPGYNIPILVFGGKYKYLPLPLYHFNANGEGHSRSNQYEKMRWFYDEYDRLCKTAIERLPECIADIDRKKRLFEISLISSLIHKYQFAVQLEDGKEHIAGVLMELLNQINGFFKFEQPISMEQAIGAEETLIKLVTDVLTDCSIDFPLKKIPKRIIGYGAMGKVATRLLPNLKGTLLEPDILWDISGDGATVKKPDFGSLGADDLLLVFPKGNVLAEISDDIKGTGCAVMEASDIAANIPLLRFPQLILAH
jgi:hypothetical protein